MQNEELLQELVSRISKGQISTNQVLGVIGAISPSPTATKESSHISLTKVLYILGVAVIVPGIIFLGNQIWSDIGSLGRITITFVLGFVFAMTGSYFLKAKAESHLGAIFHTIGAILIPSGSMVILDEMSSTVTQWDVTLTFGIIFLFYLLLTLYHKHQVLTAFAVASGTSFIYLLVGAMLNSPGQYNRNLDDIYAYLTMAIGLSYLLLSWSFSNTWNKNLVGLLNFFGSVGFFSAAFYKVFDNYGIWELLFFVLTIGGMAYAVSIKSKSILVISTMFLVSHLMHITSKYFADSIGWPISLVILGFIIIGLGYFSISLSKKYLST